MEALTFSLLLLLQDPEPPMSDQEVIETMREIQELMGRAEELLQRAASGEDVQERIVELLQMMERSEDSQNGAIESLSELIRRAPQQGEGSGQGQDQPGPSQQQGMEDGEPQSGQPQAGDQPAQRPYDPYAQDPIHRFRSEGDRMGHWDRLPPRAREALLHDMRNIDEFPVEYQRMLREYFRRLNEED